MKLGRKTLPILIATLLLAVLAWFPSSVSGQSSQRYRVPSGSKSNRPRGMPVKYQQPGQALDEIERQERQRFNAPMEPQPPPDEMPLVDPPANEVPMDNVPAENEPLVDPRNEPMDEPGMDVPMNMPMNERIPSSSDRDTLPKPPTTPPTRKPPTTKKPPSAVLPYAEEHHAHPAYESEVDSFVGNGEWDGGGGDCCGGCGGGFCGGDGCCNSCGCHGFGWYGRGEYMLVWAAGQDVPALVTTSPTGTARGRAGVIGQPGTTILYGDDSLNSESRSGARAAAGFWLSPCFAIEGEYLTLGESKEGFSLASAATGNPTIARPFVNINGVNDANLIAYNLNGNAALIGTIDINAFSSFESSSVLMRYAADALVDNGRYYTLDYLAGYRYARLHDRLTFATSTRSVEQPSSVPVGTVIDVNESFNTTNRFIGADFGFRMHSQRGAYSLDITARCAVGSIAREMQINGNTMTTVPGAAAVNAQGGLLTQRSNIGGYRDDMFSVMPDVNAKLGLAISPNLKLTAGYNFIALANVARAGEQIDTTLNLTQAGNRPLVGDPRPGATFRDTGYWAHGVSFGLEGEF